MKKILALGASSSSQSINKKLAFYAASLIQNAEVNLLDLNDFEMPIFSEDREKANGIHEKAKEFKSQIDKADAIVVSYAEHNGSYSAAFKNIYDWTSRIEGKVWQEKPILLLATSPGPRGGQGVLATASTAIKWAHKDSNNPVAEFSLPSFYDNFSEKEGITNTELKAQLEEQVEIINKTL